MSSPQSPQTYPSESASAANPVLNASPNANNANTRRWRVDQLRVSVFETRWEMGHAAATAAAAALQAAIAERGAARLILASAPSQNEFLDVLTQLPVDWPRVTLFHMDEYVGLDASHPASFRRFQQERVLSRIQPEAFHGIRGESADPEAECRRYAELLAEAPIDVVCLGIGENGHLAFNDPPVADFEDPKAVKVVELDQACREQQVHDGCFPTLDAVPRLAITLTIPALLGGKSLFCVVPGIRKSRAIRDTLNGPVATSCPASILRTHRAVRLYTDAAAAALV